MAKIDRKVEAGPDDGEKHMTTDDARQLLADLYALGDDGGVLLYAKTTIGGKVTRLWATPDLGRPMTPARDWEELLDPVNRPAELDHPVVPELDAPPAERTMEIDASQVGPRPAALTQRGGRHKRQ